MIRCAQHPTRPSEKWPRTALSRQFLPNKVVGGVPSVAVGRLANYNMVPVSTRERVLLMERGGSELAATTAGTTGVSSIKLVYVSRAIHTTYGFKM